jgi:Zn-dependent protease with chaperone function
LFVLLLLFSTSAVFAAEIDDFDRKVTAELTALDAGAVPAWTQANAAREADQHEQAVALYASVVARVPSFSHALRRQAGEELELGRRDIALTHAREALALARSPENLSLLSAALIHGGKATQQELAEAKDLAQEATGLQPKGPYEHGALADVAIAMKDWSLLQSTSERLAVIAPKDPATHLYGYYAAIVNGDFDTARTELDEARTLGLSQEAYEGLVGDMNDVMPFYLRWWKPAAITLAVWFVSFGLLLVAGVLLSRVAMRAARDTPAHLAQNVTGLSSRVRKAYGAVLTMSSIFYYISIPIVMLLVVAVLGGVIYGFFALGRIPIKLVILLVVVMGVSLWSMLKSLFVKVSDEEPGRKIDLATQPRLRNLLDDVALQIGTRAVDNVYLTPGTDVAVMERGKSRTKERCLILGIAAIDALKVRPFKAILGHEYGHFSNRDTAGGAFALSVRRSLGATAVALAQGGVAAWYNPAWLFVNGFHRVFLRISEGASRLQEILADRWAVFAYGAAAFEEGLRSVVAQSVRFDAHVGATLKEVVDGQLPLTNLYTYRPSMIAKNLDDDIADALNREGSVYDSHPPAAERFALVRALNAPEPPAQADDDWSAWTLFANVEPLQRAMTAQVRANVRTNYGIEIATSRWCDDAVMLPR